MVDPVPHVEVPARSVVLPMHNEAQRIGRTLSLIADSPLRENHYEILLVDDGSSDGTPDLAEKHAADLGLTNVKVIRAAMNRGKGAAVRAGMLAARGTLRAFADADLSVGIADIEECFDRLDAGQAEVIYASRAHPDSEITAEQPGHRVMTGRVFNFVLRTLGLTDERDTQCGLKGFTGEAADTLFAAVTIEGFAFDVEVLALARREGMRVSPMPTSWAHVDASRVRPFHDGVDMLKDVLVLWRALHKAGPSPHVRRDDAPEGAGPT
jgi:dolichyl-phosphate beta-glucosyltransferase